MFNWSPVIAGKVMEPPIMNGAGACKTMEDVDLMCRSSAGGMVIGSGTIPKRDGNDGQTWQRDEYRSLNSIGLRNPGRLDYERDLPRMVEKAHAAGKAVHFSVAGNTPGEYAELALLGQQANVDCIEINLGCPNKYGPDGQQQRIACYVPFMVGEILDAVRNEVGPLAKISAKVSYYPDISQLVDVSDHINNRLWDVSAVVAINTLANCVAFNDKGEHLLVPQHKGQAGMGGRAIKPVGLGQVQWWRSLLKTGIQVIGVGGISSGRDILEYFWAGADAVQITSALLNESGHIDQRSIKLLETIVLGLDQWVDAQRSTQA